MMFMWIKKNDSKCVESIKLFTGGVKRRYYIKISCLFLGKKQKLAYYIGIKITPRKEKKMSVIYWFRHDLRLHDNVMLCKAAHASDDIIPVFICDQPRQRKIGEAKKWWLKHSLVALAQDLKKRGIELLIKHGKPEDVLVELSKRYHADTLYFDSAYTQNQTQEKRLISLLENANLKVISESASSLTAPDNIKTQQGQCYKVFTPYYRTVLSHIDASSKPKAVPKLSQTSTVRKKDTSFLHDIPEDPQWSAGFSRWTPGEKGARKQFTTFINNALITYKSNRDIPSLSSTSYLSPHLSYGEISTNEIWYTLQSLTYEHPKLTQCIDAFLRQLIWREFSYYLLFHCPTLVEKNFQPKFDHFPWKNNSTHLKAWQQGLTGFPIVDAGMRELWHTGYMHNRVRMITASFLTKDLLIDWRQGEKWFWNTLLDADIANNAFGWQWVAGSGADAAPYFRIFNPVLQSKKFDPNGDYIRKWLPELKQLHKKYIHFPSLATIDELEKAKIILGKTYPTPIVDHSNARKLALEAYQKIKNYSA